MMAQHRSRADDLGSMAQVCIERLSGKMAFMRGAGWHLWDGTAWEKDGLGKAFNFIASIASELNHRGKMQMGSAAFVCSVRCHLQKLSAFTLLPVDAFVLRHAGRLAYEQDVSDGCAGSLMAGNLPLPWK
jgi:hypothetical protein